MTRLCVVATGKDHETIVKMVREAAAEGTEMVELRLDHLRNPQEELPALQLAMEAHPLPDGPELVASVRATADGGAYQGDERSRLSLLERAARLEVGWLDLEGALPREDMVRLVGMARREGRRTLVSWHVRSDQDPQPILDEAVALHSSGLADAVKLVLPVGGRGGLDALLRISSRLSAAGVPKVLLPSGRLSRLGRMLAPIAGSEWVYVELVEGGTLGPLGLPSHREVRSAWSRMGYTGMPGVEQRPAPPMSVADAGEDWALLALLGDPVEHTNSPVVHHAAMAALGMRGVYVPLQTPMGAVAAALEDLQAAGAMGCNVTVPLKVEAAASVDRLDTGARRSGAVNTVRFSAGAGTEGFNTDADGVRMAAAELLGGATAGATALVVGTGGAARGAIVGLADCGARVLATGRNPGHLEAMVAGLEGLAVSVDPGGLPGLEGGVDLLVQCTSQGMHGVPPSGPLEPVKVLEALRPKAVLDMVYSPGGTDLVRAAVAQGLPCAGGDRVLLLQAAVGFEVWTGRKAPLQAMEGALRAALGRPG